MAPKFQGNRLSPRAKNDLENIWLYTFQTWSRDQADEYYSKLVGAISHLADGSRRGKQIDDVKGGYFCLASGSHYIIYRHDGARLIIVRILHQRMKIGRHL